jgi:hypothetical protein
MGAADSRSLHSDSYVRIKNVVRHLLMFPFDVFGGDVRREFMQSLSAALQGTLSSYPRDALQEDSADAVWHAFLFLGLLRPVGFFPSFLLFAWWVPPPLSCKTSPVL